MKQNRLTILTALFAVLFCMSAGSASAGSGLEFSLHKLDSGVPGPTLLVIGGIQGDEPGGFNAASLLVSRYRITKGRVWVVPNLNFLSIIKRSRGVHGDMNRKFSKLAKGDPEYDVVSRIKSIILSPEVDLVLNLHDGSGFYRPQYEDSQHCPARWGQSVIIDQSRMDHPVWGDLAGMGEDVVREVNRSLVDDEHIYHLKNTETAKGNEEMSKTLTFFAITNGKPAFGVEASKNFGTHYRAYYHLLVLESFMKRLGIGYERSFGPTVAAVRAAIDSDAALGFSDRRIFLDLVDVRSSLNYFPLRKDADLDFTPSNPLVTVVGRGEDYQVYYGNRRMTRLSPQFFEYDYSQKGLTMNIDGSLREVRFGERVSVRSAFCVEPEEGCRVNVIGFTTDEQGDESGLTVRETDFYKRFSVDTKGKVFRVEAYRSGRFAGMVLVDFDAGRQIASSRMREDAEPDTGSLEGR